MFNILGPIRNLIVGKNQQQMLQSMMQQVMEKMDNDSKPYRNTKIGFGATL
jgi:hypothetical protein